MLVKEVTKFYCLFGTISRYYLSEQKFNKCRRKVIKLVKTGKPVDHIFEKDVKNALRLKITRDVIGYTIEEKYSGDTRYHSCNKTELKNLFEID